VHSPPCGGFTSVVLIACSPPWSRAGAMRPGRRRRGPYRARMRRVARPWRASLLEQPFWATLRLIVALRCPRGKVRGSATYERGKASVPRRFAPSDMCWS
jgi:hypothetical protein